MSELTRMRSGETYNCLDEELKLMRAKTAQLVFQFNHEPNPGIRRQLLAEMGVQLENSACIEPPLQLTYGCHLSIGENTYINWDAIILDNGQVEVGANRSEERRVGKECC